MAGEPVQVPPASITWTNRPKTGSFQMGCGFLGLVMVMLQVVIALYIITGTNGSLDFRAALEDKCPPGQAPVGMHCLDISLRDEAYLKYATGFCGTVPGMPPSSRRRLLDNGQDDLMNTQPYQKIVRRLDAEDDSTMWDRFGQNAVVPGVLAPLVFVVAVLWIALLQKFAKQCIYGAFLVAGLFFVFMSIFPMFGDLAVCLTPAKSFSISNDDFGKGLCLMMGGSVSIRPGKLLWIFLIPPIAMLVLAWCFKKKIHVASVCLSKCCLCLQQRPGIIVAGLGVFASFAIYILMWVGFALQFFSHFEITCDTTQGTPQVSLKDNGTLMKIMGILLVPTYIYFEMMIIVVVAAGVGGWYFPDGAPSNPAISGLKWAYSSSSGAIFLATVITWPIIEIRNYLHGMWGKFAVFPCLPCSWVYYVFYIMWCCFMRAYLAFTKFMLIAHTFHGGDLFVTARNAWAVLKKHLGGAVVTESIAAYVLYMGVWVISVGFAFIAWVWMESEMGDGFLVEIMSSRTEGQGTMIIVILLIGVVSWLCKHSLFTIIVLALAGQYLTGETFVGVHPFMCGAFIGAICNIIFCFIAKIVQAGMDTIFYCFALEAEHAVSQSREGFADITNMIKENIVQPLPKYLEEGDANTIYVKPKTGEDASAGN